MSRESEIPKGKCEYYVTVSCKYSNSKYDIDKCIVVADETLTRETMADIERRVKEHKGSEPSRLAIISLFRLAKVSSSDRCPECGQPLNANGMCVNLMCEFGNT